ncbi:MAG: hypothetical protein BGO43_05275 [Gammaproteobacteria bacterium 39-13]|nr:DNA-3-methyladenine glycosylase I [Gammaproteobacteria bacterium]OJV96253.1 MAG: hypothetical protein BGO43_05275 [Gammaproteobacteria bacterium 39-13]
MKKQSKLRCAWVNLENPLYVTYHDKEWGRPVHDDVKHFEMLTLEGAQAGLSWETILNKREHYRKVFAKFAPKKVAKFSQNDVERILKDPGVVRNRLKIESTISNAKAFLEVQKEFGSFDKYIWGFVQQKTIHQHHKDLTTYPTKTSISDAISKDLKKRGFRFVGSTIIYAYMQAIGLVNDHQSNCFVLEKEKQTWFVYVIQCKDGSWYTGVATDVKRRFQEHQEQGKKCAKYLKGKGPLKLVFKQLMDNKVQAYQAEYLIKRLTKKQKNEVIKNKVSLKSLLKALN